MLLVYRKDVMKHKNNIGKIISMWEHSAYWVICMIEKILKPHLYKCCSPRRLIVYSLVDSSHFVTCVYPRSPLYLLLFLGQYDN